MKLNQSFFGLSMILAMSASSLANAADPVLWQCTGDNIEGISVSADQGGKYPAGVAWDCWGGGGICQTNAKTTLKNEGGKMVFNSADYTLEIDKNAGGDNSHDAHISATAQGPSDMGGGLDIDEDVTCTPGDSN
jgi:hypothetical protein